MVQGGLKSVAPSADCIEVPNMRGCVLFCLLFVCCCVRFTVHKFAEAACSFLYLAFALFVCCSGYEVVLARYTSSCFFLQ
jgi:hypothetical protein